MSNINEDAIKDDMRRVNRDIPEDIIRRAQAGDVRAFEEVYRRYGRDVYAISLRILANTSDAQDVTQDVFVTLFRKLKDFRFKAALRTWIYRVAINAALNCRKKRARTAGRQVNLEDYPAAGAGAPEAQNQADNEARMRLAAALMDRLNPGQKACLVLRSIEGMSYREIAQTLNIGINTVRSRIRRARLTLLALRHEETEGEL